MKYSIGSSIYLRIAIYPYEQKIDKYEKDEEITLLTPELTDRDYSVFECYGMARGNKYTTKEHKIIIRHSENQ